ncbi:MAG: transporter associated domain-containing protein [Pseudomonadota bacterium]
MSDESHSPSQSVQRTWLERLSQALIREPQDRGQLVEVLREAEHKQILDAESLQMIEGVLQVSELHVRDVMVPRTQMIVIDHDASLQQILPIVIKSGHSRFPVIGNERDEIRGIMLAKDLLQFAFAENGKTFKLKEILRPVLFIPESKRLDVLLREFRLNHNHMAIVVDEYGGIAGLATIEDVLEQIVGDIEDEYDIDEDNFIRQVNENTYMVSALTPIEDFNEYFNDKLSNEEFDTIGGLIVNHFGYLPKRAESIQFAKYQVKIINADTRRIRLMQFQL